MLPDPPKEYDDRYMRELIRFLEQELGKFQGGNTRKYTFNTFTVRREIDLDTATQDEVNEFVITFLSDLYNRQYVS